MPLSSVLGAQSLVRPGVCTSSTRPASPFEGQTIYETDTDRLATWDGSAWIPYVRQTAGKVLQVVQSIKTDTFSTSSTTFTDVTGLTATITPSATSNKIFIVGMVNYSTTTGSGGSPLLRLSGGNATTFVGDAASNRVRAALFSIDAGSWALSSSSLSGTMVYLDSPSTTSATTYSIQMRQGTAGPVFVNRSGADTDNANYARLASSITLMEITA